ncbi:Cytochrome b-c1 complex subunit 10, mitochondrial [Fulvia fulva]|uniref:Cytochrome b-c1 complex subunit 10, mitochondrial n=1 Tax=Passalora fulva TaxID=5499 RepID=A0A9Q8P5I5_PASFU|nr:Cytochrome b-c1 complex subunit 10, mitochondrial [Fulvia fulva]KAK4632359.1 Cytochrome b-c1 complex subunit 10, mitochondrial [Fulvia fulva]KAK4633926.1 Cytochrome b-c1 complex subunit 10, mitochondrial [Fulvia fulva]UJO14160.1 Cytochrome b-c1 complex subunit 10, mitochondrial [Fulvia fulva]WPV11793.1 Cytochrome b-c1 complex subunit 10, mitochondrial [Fulvia fulva]WPV25473.1 Cytochrome b-c1 complex subunit 10, mitochondrial [Fulvia fulva]
MQPTLGLRSNFGMTRDGVKGQHPWRQPQTVKAYKSPYGPQYKNTVNFYGVNAQALGRAGIVAGAFGVSAGVFALFFFDGVPRVQKDIIQKIPFVGKFFINEIPPEDNPF